MKNLSIGIVAEGPTDYNMIQSLVLEVIPGDHFFAILQPEISATEGFGAFGAGWKGVREWCFSIAQEHGNLANLMKAFVPILDILIIHIDADVSREAEVNCSKPCPPASDTICAIESVIQGWLAGEKLSSKVVLCVPSDNTEAWVLSAFGTLAEHHCPPNTFLECLHKPDYVIANPPYQIIKTKNGKPKKTQSRYREFIIPKVLENWGVIKDTCIQAQLFEERLLAATLLKQ